MTVVIAGTGRVDAQSVNEREAKVAYLFNFAKFVEWPADVLPAGSPIALCVLGDSAMAFDLSTAVRGREIAGRKVSVIDVKGDGSLAPCHLLYVTGLDQKHLDHLLAATVVMPLFTVGDADRFAERGGVASLFFDGGRMRFSINVNTAQRAHLTISSRLLALATIIKDEARVRE